MKEGKVMQGEGERGRKEKRKGNVWQSERKRETEGKEGREDIAGERVEGKEGTVR